MKRKTSGKLCFAILGTFASTSVKLKPRIDYVAVCINMWQFLK